MKSWYPVHASHEPNVNTKILNYAALPIILGKFNPKYSAHAQSELPTSHYFTIIIIIIIIIIIYLSWSWATC
jgi:hypothetical protein